MREQFDAHWPKLKKALHHYGPTHKKEDVWALIEQGKAQFWPGTRSAIVTEILTWPTGFKELRGWLAAGDIKEIRVMEKFIAGWAAENGCRRALLAGRRGWLRGFDGYREHIVMIAKDLST